MLILWALARISKYKFSIAYTNQKYSQSPFLSALTHSTEYSIVPVV